MTLFLLLAWRNLWRHSRRTWLTASAIAFSTALLLFLNTLQLGAYDMMIETSLRLFTGPLQVQRKGYQDKPQMRATVPRALALASEIRGRIPGVKTAVRANAFALAASRSRTYGVMVLGEEPQREPAVSLLPGLVKSGRYLKRSAAAEAVVGDVLARNLGVKVGDELTLLGAARDGSVAAAVLTVAGLFATGVPDVDRSVMKIPLKTFGEVFAMGKDAHVIVLSVPDLRGLAAVKASTQALLARRPDLAVLDWKELMPGLDELIRADWTNAWFIYVILILVVTLSILNTFLMSVLERTREFGIMMALGLAPIRIAALVLMEALLLTLLGIGVGISIGGAISFYFHVQGFTFPGMRELYAQYGLPGLVHNKLSALAFLLGPAIILAFTLAAALIPAFRIRRMQAVDAMKQV